MIEKLPRKKTIMLVILFVFLPLISLIRYNFLAKREGLSYESQLSQGDFEFLYDLTFKDPKNQEKIIDQEIIDQIEKLIANAEDFVIMDIFLFNGDYDKSQGMKYPHISKKIVDALLKKKEKSPNTDIILITDPINSMYNSYLPDNFKKLSQAGVEIIDTDLSKVRDSNPLYSGFYRTYLNKIPYSKKGIFPNIFDSQKPKATLRSYLDLLNFKANHRKIIISEKTAIVTSANIHDGSANHSNIGLKVRGPIVNSIIESELSVVKISGHKLENIGKYKFKEGKLENPLDMKIVTEGKIKKEILKNIEASGKGDKIKIGAFYIADKNIIRALEEASERGTKIKLVLDLNKDAFGKSKIGIPNKPVATRLSRKDNIEIRWYETQGEQFHSKFTIFEQDDKVILLAGSANLTRRNLDDLNLESNLAIYGNKKDPQMIKVLDYYDQIWYNIDGIYTAPYETYEEDKIWKNIIYKIQEVTGLSTF